MATGKRVFTSQTWIEGGSGSWTTLSGTTKEWSSDVDLATNGYDGAHVMVEIDFDSSPTDDVDVFIHGSLDGTNYDDVPFKAMRVDNGTDPAQLSFVIHDLAHFAVVFQQTGSTDSHNVRASYMAWRRDIS